MHHCSDETLLSHLDAELSPACHTMVIEHLGSCWSCRNRLASLEQQIYRLVEVSQRGHTLDPVWRKTAEAKLQARIAAHRRSNSPRHSRKQPWFKFSPRSWGRAAWVASLIAGVAGTIGILSLLPPKVEAKATLLRSVQGERLALAHLQGQYKTWNIEEYAAGRMVARRRVEQWQGKNAKPAALRVYDDRRALVAGEWVSKNGSRTRYRKGQRTAAAGAVSETPIVPRDIDEAGLFELSTQEFMNLAGNDSQADIRKDSGSFIVEFAGRSVPAGAPGPKLLKATLVLVEDGLRPTSGSFVVDSASDRVEYRLQETGLQRYVNEPPPPHVFDPENVEEEVAAPIAIATSTKSVPLAEKPGAQTPVSTNPALEVSIIQQLALENITLGEHVKLERRPDGTMDLHIRVASEEKKSSVEASLANLVAEGGLRLDFRIEPEEQPGSVTGAAPWILRQWATQKLERDGVSPRGEDVERLAQTKLLVLRNNVERMHSHAIAIREIGERFRQVDLDQLSEEQREGWKTAVLQHIEALQTETVLLQNELIDISDAPTPAEATTSSGGTATVQAVTQDIERLRRAMNALLASSSQRGNPGVGELARLIQACQARLAALRTAFESQ